MISRYQTKHLQELWSDHNKYAVWFLVERVYLCAHLQAQGKYHESFHARLLEKASRIDWSRFAQSVAHYDALVEHDVIAFLHALEDELQEDARLIHQGLTSTDVVDTAFAYLLKQANLCILDQLKELIKVLWQQAQNYRGVICLGRTHGQAAEPITFGIKLLGHVCEFARNYKRLVIAARELQVGKLSGAVGVYSFTSPEIEMSALSALELVPETVSTQVVARDRHAHYFSMLAVLAGSIERLATEIRLLMHGQVGEVAEPFSAQQKGSSAMPHKKNPVASENLCGLSRMMRSYALAALENQALWHERDISHSSVERIIAPDATSLMDFALKRLTNLINNLVVNKERLQKNLDDVGDVQKSQALMQALIEKGMLRQQAYELLQTAALRTQGLTFRDKLIGAGVVAIIGDDQCERILKSDLTPKYEDELFARALVELNGIIN